MIDYPRSQPTRDPDIRLWREAPNVWRILARLDIDNAEAKWALIDGTYPRRSDAVAALPSYARGYVAGTVRETDTGHVTAVAEHLAGHHGRPVTNADRELAREIVSIVRKIA